MKGLFLVIFSWQFEVFSCSLGQGLYTVDPHCADSCNNSPHKHLLRLEDEK